MEGREGGKEGGPVLPVKLSTAFPGFCCSESLLLHEPWMGGVTRSTTKLQGGAMGGSTYLRCVYLLVFFFFLTLTGYLLTDCAGFDVSRLECVLLRKR